jgi:hypothetical protein
VSSWWQEVVNQRSGFKLKTLKQFKLRRFQGPGGWLLGLTFVVAMLFWNWKLLLATVVGVLVMLLVYLMQEWDWQVHWSSLRRFFSGANRQLTIAVGSGGMAAVSTYMAVSVWADSDSPWIAAGAILQGFGTLATLILLVWQILNRQAHRWEANLNQLLTDLTHADPLKRLIAVRQITQCCQDRLLETAKEQTISDYFRLMLSRESETVVRDAVLEGLQTLDDTRKLSKAAPTFSITARKQSVTRVRRRRDPKYK